MKEVQLKVSNMSCGSCAKHVERAIQSVNGVQSVQVELSTGVAKVRIDTQSDEAELTLALNEAGYPSSITHIKV
jgi:copper chaperone CopZ